MFYGSDKALRKSVEIRRALGQLNWFYIDVSKDLSKLRCKQWIPIMDKIFVTVVPEN